MLVTAKVWHSSGRSGFWCLTIFPFVTQHWPTRRIATEQRRLSATIVAGIDLNSLRQNARETDSPTHTSTRIVVRLRTSPG